MCIQFNFKASLYNLFINSCHIDLLLFSKEQEEGFDFGCDLFAKYYKY